MHCPLKFSGVPMMLMTIGCATHVILRFNSRKLESEHGQYESRKVIVLWRC